MATLVELLVELGIKDAGFEKGMGEAPREADKAVGGIQDKFAGLGGKLAPLAAGAGAAAGAAIVAGVLEGIEQEALTDKVAAQLNLTESESALAGEIAGDLYADAFGESFGDVSETVGDVIGTFDGLDAGAIEDITAKAENLEAAFDIEDAVTRAGVLVETGLAGDVDEAMDLITASMQEVAPGLRDELGEATTEYSKFFADLGFSGEETFGLLASADDKFSLDKTGDAIKELSIRATDGSTATVDAFTAMGLDAEKMSDKILAGGDEARGAFDEIVDGLLGMESPSGRAQAAIALFGTPLEDLGTKNIPDFLSSLQDTGGGLEDVAGRAEKMGDTLNDNVATKASGAWRTLKQSFVENVGGAVLPMLSNLMSWFAEKLPGAIAFFEEVFGAIGGFFQENIVPAFQTVIGWFQSTEESATGSFGGIRAFVEETWPKIQEVISGVMEIIQTVVSTVLEGIRVFWETHGETIMGIASNVWETIKTVIDTVLGVVQGIIDTVMGVITGDWDRAWEGIKGIVSSVWDGIKGVVENVLGIIQGVIDVVLGGIEDTWNSIWGGIESFVSDTWDNISGFVSSGVDEVVDFIAGIPGRIAEFASGMWDELLTSFKSIINKIIGWWNGLSFDLRIPSNAVTDFFQIGGRGFTINTPDIPTLHDGGVFHAANGREGLALLEDGETVLPAGQGGMFDGASFNFFGLPSQMARDVSETVGVEVRWATG